MGLFPATSTCSYGGRQKQGIVQRWQEGCQEEGRRSFHQEGLVRYQGSFHLQDSRCRQDFGQPHPRNPYRLRRFERPRVRGLPLRFATGTECREVIQEVQAYLRRGSRQELLDQLL